MSVTNETIAVVANPVGGEEEREGLTATLQAHGLEVTWLDTTEDDPGVGQTRRAAEQGAGVVIACGGDGTVRACIEGLIGTETALAIVPAGTGNLLVRNLGIGDDPADIVDVIRTGRRRRIDVGFANGEAFAVMAGAGLDAAVMRDTSRRAKDVMGSLAYVITGLSHLRDDTVRCSIDLDDREVFRGDVATVLAANLGSLQAGVELFPEADAADGALDFMAINASTVGSWLRSAAAVLTRREVPQLVERWTGSNATLRFAVPTPYQLDGEERPATDRLVIETRSRAVTVCVPKGNPPT